MSTHADKANQFNLDKDRVLWHDSAVWHLRANRDAGLKDVSQWEALREAASQIKMNTLSNLNSYLEQFERQASSNGIIIHWAIDGNEHNQIVKKILDNRSINHIVKSKSILTEECGLNHFLELNNIEVIDTDLGERVVQLAKERPSHIVAPAIHKKRMEIDLLFQQTMNMQPQSGDPQKLTEAARSDLRKRFMSSSAALTGVNFAVAESGAFIVCTNEGNADLGAHLSAVHIASMGMEKIIPRMEDLGVFLRLLSRSANGQSITSYTSHFFKPRPGQEMHLIIVDNGRSKLLGEPDFRNSLKCIRCGACMNTCPVYRRSGGHSYQSVIPGPIGSILTPSIDMKQYASLPFASTLCGSCTDVCPVKIDIHDQLYKWRQVIMRRYPQVSKSITMKLSASLFASPLLYRIAGSIARITLRILPRPLIYNRFNKWGLHRELPAIPSKSFRSWYKTNKTKKEESK